MSNESITYAWFRESHCMAKHAERRACARRWCGLAPCDKSDNAHVVMLSHERMKRIGMVYEGGNTERAGSFAIVLDSSQARRRQGTVWCVGPSRRQMAHP